MRLSYSRKNKYDFCSMAYRYSYVEKWNLKHSPRYFPFGGAVHQVASEIIAGMESIPQIWKLSLDEKYKRGGLEWTQEEYDLGLNMLIAFRQAIEGIEIVEPEGKFLVKGWRKGIDLYGFFDCKAVVNGQLRVVDWKTSAREYHAWEAKTSSQLKFYCLANKMNAAAYGVLMKKYPSVLLWYTAEFTDEQLKEYERELEITVEGIIKKRFVKNEGKHCKRCDFRPLCFGPKEEINLTLRKGYRKF